MTESDSESNGTEQGFYWRCGGCNKLFPHGNHRVQWEHAEEAHGSFDAVTFEAVPSWKIDTESEGPHEGDADGE